MLLFWSFEGLRLAGFFYRIGRKLGPKVRKGKWVWQSLTGSEADMIAAEHDVGRDLAAEIRLQTRPSGDPRDGELLEEIGSRLVARVANKLRRFNFEAIDGDEPNAFALPGGYIFITHSLLELCEWDMDRIAFVLAHEMAHVMRSHAIGRVAVDSAINVAGRAGPIRGAISGWIKRVGVQYLQSAYSQDRELEADRLATQLIVAGRFDPAGGEKLFACLAKHHPNSDPAGLSKYFASHPQFAERIAEIRKISRKQPKKCIKTHNKC
jgi:predicted Zn-dependent protease